MRLSRREVARGLERALWVDLADDSRARRRDLVVVVLVDIVHVNGKNRIVKEKGGKRGEVESKVARHVCHISHDPGTYLDLRREPLC